MGCYGICMWLCGEKCFLLVGVGITRGVGTGALGKLGDSTEYRRWVLETGRLSVYVIIV